mmetsp:Transcript_49499/g.131340  ORF Transcript_49499/g.131340 Transcript_49499/m.131340 type:complete len:214 (-) Transcript_49499:40-681(-)
MGSDECLKRKAPNSFVVEVSDDEGDRFHAGDVKVPVRMTPDFLPCAAEPEHVSTLTLEVRRIVALGSAHFSRILNLSSSEPSDLSVIQSRYRRLMLLLHPDKRCPLEESRAGGREFCDEALRSVQNAMLNAKAEALPDERAELQKTILRMQRIQRQQARQAMIRHQEPVDVSSLLREVTQAMAKPVSENVPVFREQASNSTTLLMDALANFRR